MVPCMHRGAGRVYPSKEGVSGVVNGNGGGGGGRKNHDGSGEGGWGQSRVK